MLAAVVQLCSQDDVPRNLAHVRTLVGEASRAGATLVTLPENFAYFGPAEKKRTIAESLEGDLGPIMFALTDMAREFDVFILGGGMPEASGHPERPFNTSVLINPEGVLQARYRKRHLFDVELPDGSSYKESTATMPGDLDVTITEVVGIKLGMSVCYDLRFPELYRQMGALGAQAMTVPAAFTVHTGKDHWHALLRARAIENQVYVLAPAQQGKHPGGLATYGKSLIADPWGDVIAQVSDGEGFAVAQLDIAFEDRVRAAVPCLTHRRS